MIGFEHGTLALQACLLTTVPRGDYVVQKKQQGTYNIIVKQQGCVQSSEQPNCRIFINPVAVHGLGIQSFSFILFRLVLTLNELRIYKVINVGLS